MPRHPDHHPLRHRPAAIAVVVVAGLIALYVLTFQVGQRQSPVGGAQPTRTTRSAPAAPLPAGAPRP